MVIVLIVLTWFGLALGSFANALIFRLHEQSKKRLAISDKRSAKVKKQTVNNQQLAASDLSIVKGRSICPHCHHQLAVKDLVPIFSWLALRGRCRYCKKPISAQYPLVELATALVFVLSYIWWPGEVDTTGDWVLFITWLIASVGLLALLVYDIRWWILPNKIIYPTLLIAAAGRLVYIIGFAPHKGHELLWWLLSVAVASGIFWLLFVISRGKWIGFGDVRLGLITGTTLASPALSFLMIFGSSVLGTLFILPGLLSGKKTVTSKLPYGPFLIVSTWLTLLFGSSILDWYKSTFGL